MQKEKQVSNTKNAAGDSAGANETPLLQETVQTLSKMIKDLEAQLERMLSINEALEGDLEKEKRKTSRTLQDRDLLQEQIGRMEQEIASIEDLRAEIGHLGGERSRLATMIEEFGHQLADSEKENRKLDALAERMRAERDDSLEELQSVEEQFDRAMDIVADLRSRVESLAEERDTLVARMKVVETQFQVAEEQRDSLRSEVDDSRKALDEIRRQVADACDLSQRYYSQQTEPE